MKARRFGPVLALAAALLASRAAAVEPGEVLPDPALEARARTISAELRCLVCQNQSIDDSHADLARDLRLLVRERLAAGDSDDGVERYLVARYGDFVLLKPPFERDTVLLWSLPFLVLATGAAGLALARRATPRRPTAPLSPAEEEELARLVAAGPTSGSPHHPP